MEREADRGPRPVKLEGDQRRQAGPYSLVHRRGHAKGRDSQLLRHGGGHPQTSRKGSECNSKRLSLRAVLACTQGIPKIPMAPRRPDCPSRKRGCLGSRESGPSGQSFVCIPSQSTSSFLFSFPSPVLLKLSGNRPHGHCYTSPCHPALVLWHNPLLRNIKN